MNNSRRIQELKALESQLQEAKYQARKYTVAAEAPVSCGNNEVIPRASDLPVADPHHPKQSYGGNSETPTCTRKGLPIIYRGRRPRSRARTDCHYI
jgi:hypothetical protein